MASKHIDGSRNGRQAAECMYPAQSRDSKHRRSHRDTAGRPRVCAPARPLESFRSAVRRRRTSILVLSFCSRAMRTSCESRRWRGRLCWSFAASGSMPRVCERCCLPCPGSYISGGRKPRPGSRGWFITCCSKPTTSGEQPLQQHRCDGSGGRNVEVEFQRAIHRWWGVRRCDIRMRGD